MTKEDFQNLKIGDLVKLNSDSPVLTVMIKGEDGYMDCAFWGVEAGKILHTGKYHFSLFRKIE